MGTDRKGGIMKIADTSMNLKMDREKIEDNLKNILVHCGVENEEVLQNTPKRARKMFDELLEGMKYSNEQIVEMYNKTFITNSETKLCGTAVVERDIDIVSICEHHMALMYGMKVDIVYVPTKNKVIGLSKLARISELVGKRFQLQERIGDEIVWILSKILETPNIMVRVRSKHSCCSYRGVKNVNMETITLHYGCTGVDEIKQLNELFLLGRCDI